MSRKKNHYETLISLGSYGVHRRRSAGLAASPAGWTRRAPTYGILRTFTTDTGVIARLIYDADAANPLELCGPGVGFHQGLAG